MDNEENSENTDTQLQELLNTLDSWETYRNLAEEEPEKYKAKADSKKCNALTKIRETCGKAGKSLVIIHGKHVFWLENTTEGLTDEIFSLLKRCEINARMELQQLLAKNHVNFTRREL